MDSKKRFSLIAGPCVIESELATLEVADHLARLAQAFDFDLIFKASFDKANRMALQSYRGPGLTAGLDILAKVKKQFHLPITTDIHEPYQAEAVAEVADIIQIPAYLCRQTDLLVAAAKTKKCVNIKKGQFMSPEQMFYCFEKVAQSGGQNIILTERGVCFGYNQLIVDMTSIEKMLSFGCKVCFDATHSVQKPGGAGHQSSGAKQYVNHLTRSALAAGAQMVFCEVHMDPPFAKSDAALQLSPKELESFLPMWISLFDLIQNHKVFSSQGSLCLQER